VPHYAGTADHVNLGLLPDARDGLWLAIQALRDGGGWLHVHESVTLKSSNTVASPGRQGRREEAVKWGQDMENRVRRVARRRWKEEEVDGGGRGRLEAVTCHVEEVKSLGKDFWHLVADVCIRWLVKQS
jgi:tRNA G37 N-methylase Trm5